MLVLSRKLHEEVVIYDPANPAVHVVVSVTEIRGEKCRLAFTANRNISIHRRETYDAIQQDNAAVARGDRQLPTGNSTGMLTAATLQE